MPCGMSFFYCAIFKRLLLWLLTDVCEDTTINIQYMTIDSIRSLRSQEYCRTTKLRRIEPATSWSLSANEAIEWVTTTVSLTLTKRSCLRSSDVARANTITLDVVLTILRADVTMQKQSHDQVHSS